MAAAIFFVSGGPLVGALSFFVPRGGVGVWGFGFSVGVLWGGGYTKNQSIFVVQCLNHTMHQAARVGC